MDHNKLWKILKEMGIPDHLTCSLRNLYVGQEATVRILKEQMIDSKLGKEYDKAVYCHPAYLTYMWSGGGLVAKSYLTLVTPLTVACQAPLSMGFSRQEYRRRQWHPTPVLLPGKSHGWRSLVGCSPWGR